MNREYYSIHEPSHDQWFERFGVEVAWQFSLRDWRETLVAWIRNTP